MPRRTAQVVDGPRQASDRDGSTSAVPESIAKLRAAVVPKADGEVVYHSDSGRYRIQLTVPMVRRDPQTGLAIENVRGKVAQFQEYEFRTKDAEMIRLLESKRAYGIGKDYWRAEDANAVRLAKVENTLVETIKAQADPESARRIVEELLPLLGSDFVLPAKQSEAEK